MSQQTYIKVHDCNQLSTGICESRQYYDENGRCRIKERGCVSDGSTMHVMMVLTIDKLHDLQNSVDRVENKLDSLFSKNFSAL